MTTEEIPPKKPTVVLERDDSAWTALYTERLPGGTASCDASGEDVPAALRGLADAIEVTEVEDG